MKAIHRISDQADPRQFRPRFEIFRKSFPGMGILPKRDRLRQEPQPARHHLERRGTQIHEK